MVGISAALFISTVLLTSGATAGASIAASVHPAPVFAVWSADINPGDVLVRRTVAGWLVIKVLAVDIAPDGISTVHCLTYDEVSERPTLAGVTAMSPRIMHAPVLADAFADNWESIGNLPVADSDLEGFTEYLKRTDFPRYLSVTSQDAGQIVQEANRNYREGNSFAEADDHERAVVAYGNAIDLFPLFFEALDNRAFSYMDLGRYDLALLDFEASLQVEPNGFSAFFSRGECLLRLGRFDEAEAVFEEGKIRFPEQSAILTEFLARVQSSRHSE